nr:unnamed protein product [Callosobruchus analis]
MVIQGCGERTYRNRARIRKDMYSVIQKYFTFPEELARCQKVLMEGIKYHANDPVLLGKTFLRLERDFDKHVLYFQNEPIAQEFLDTCDEAYDYFAVSFLEDNFYCYRLNIFCMFRNTSVSYRWYIYEHM